MSKQKMGTGDSLKTKSVDVKISAILDRDITLWEYCRLSSEDESLKRLLDIEEFKQAFGKN